MTPGQTRALQDLWPQYGIDWHTGYLNLDEIFGRQSDRILEIGFGNGESLVHQAAHDPHFDFIGIEVHQPGVGHCLLNAHENDVTNLRVINHDAIEVLQQQIPDAGLIRINLLFPDPWPKKRHHKRRIFQAGFLALAAQKLMSGGSLLVATDWQNYADHIEEVTAESGLFRVAERHTHAGDRPLQRTTTKFETRGLKKGHKIYDWRLLRI